MFNNIFYKKKVIITGNTGFKGTWLSLWLVRLGADVIGISDKTAISTPSLHNLVKQSEYEKQYVTNINDFVVVSKIINTEKPDYVFHLAAQPIVSKSYTETLDTFQTNIIGTANILEALKLLKKKCVAVMITSDKAYDNKEWQWGYRENDALGGKDPYSASKGAADIVIQSYHHSFFSSSKSKIKIGIGRAGNVIGGGDFAENRIIPDCFKAWYNNEEVLLRSPNAVRPWQHVLEPLAGYLRIAQLLTENKIACGEAYNFGPEVNQNCSVVSLVDALSNRGKTKDIKKKYKTLNKNIFKESHLLRLNWDKAFNHLQWKPVLNFDDTIEYTSDWYDSFFTKKEIKKFTVSQLIAFEKKLVKLNPLFV